MPSPVSEPLCYRSPQQNDDQDENQGRSKNSSQIQDADDGRNRRQVPLLSEVGAIAQP